MTGIASAIAAAGVLGAGASIYAGNKQAGAAGSAANLQWDIYGDTKQTLQPWIGGGTNALADLLSGAGIGGGGVINQNAPLTAPFTPDRFQADPGYQFRRQQGLDAITASGMATGLTGTTLKSLNDWAQGQASQEYGQAYGRYRDWQSNLLNTLMGVSATGANAAGQRAGIGTTVGSNVGNLMTGGAAAQAGGLVGASNAITGAGSNYLQYMLDQQILAQNQGGAPAPGMVGNYNVDPSIIDQNNALFFAGQQPQYPMLPAPQ